MYPFGKRDRMISRSSAQSVIAQNGNGKSITCAEAYFSILSEAARQMPYEMVDSIATALLSAYEQERTVFLFGNGGSASLASHFACDLGKGTASPGKTRKRFRVTALTDNIPMMTAWANDSSYEDIFAEQLLNQIRPGDVAFAISCSGNSPNVIKALKVARREGAFRIGLTGFQGGKMMQLCDLCLVIPSGNMQIIEDLHLSVAHSLFSIARDRIENGAAATLLVASSHD
jgi:D-sedoheptulose 7-phosphate isomerase